MTITTIRPDSQVISSHALTVVGAANAVAAVTDNSDSSYIQAQVANQYIRFGLGDISLSAGQRVRSLSLRFRTARDAAGGITQDAQYSLNSSVASHNGSCASIASIVTTRGVASIASGAGPMAYSGPCRVAFDQTNVNDIQLTVQWHQVHSGTQNVFQRVYELYCDVDVNNQPTISGAPVVTNFTNNAKPTVTWIYSDVDNDLQTRWRVKVFNATTIAAGNFDPETSVADWDSGDQTGQDSTVNVGSALQNGVTYTAYVKAAQDWPGPQGSLWWSAWAASSTFTITFTPPLTPTIQSASILVDTNQYRTMLSVFVPINLLTLDNSSLETSIGQWVAVTNCTVVRDTAQFADGIASMKMTSSASGDMEARCNLDIINDAHVEGGATYTALASFHANASTRSCQVGIEWLDGALATISTSFGSSVTDSASAGVWTQAVFTGAAPATARYARVHVKVLATGAASEIHWADKIDVHAGSTTTWSTGGYQNNQGDLVIERGEYLVDDRGPAENWFHPQVASAGSVLQNQGYGFWIDTTQGTLLWKWLDKLIPATGDTPPGMLDWYPSVATTSSIAFGFWFYGGTAYMVPVVQGQVHVFSFWAWTSAGTFRTQPRFDWRDASGNVVSTTTGSIVTLTTTPQQIIVTGTPPSNAVLACGATQNVDSDNTRHVFFTRFGFGLGTIPVDGKKAKGQLTGIFASGLPIGLTWKEIRSTANSNELVLPPGYNTGQIEAFPDYEVVPARPTLYRASIAYSLGSTVVKSAYSNQVVVYAAPPNVTLLRSVATPWYQVAVNRRKQMSISIKNDASVFHPLGADGAPVQVRDWVGGEDGQLIVVTATEAQKARLQALLYAGDVLQVQWAQGGRSYVLITDRTVEETISDDVDFCDAEGGALQDWIRYSVHTLTYIETVAP